MDLVVTDPPSWNRSATEAGMAVLRQSPVGRSLAAPPSDLGAVVVDIV